VTRRAMSGSGSHAGARLSFVLTKRGRLRRPPFYVQIGKAADYALGVNRLRGLLLTTSDAKFLQHSRG
jgi:hypothetical protein